ncbi:prenylated Rab acceptor protein 1-like isoform X2 [Mercenaria mercenaria]|uniref:prenylated Rab acceptor protein 1-like isoform X2 n=1 Tax=Mercenaria mercenaria TaxID=6596 RepID=UPI001E1DB00E|nr:prenylated Rab acceptor protein 1-like isoform X2 [Mercenaria mercenaria]XP_053408540.1 prenylated Rab acceptor protein 1-like isoform X2 [Mercenaria mercenaria]
MRASPNRIMALSLSNATAREWFAKTRDGIRPWGEFINTGRFQTPKSVAPMPKRIIKNIEHFQSNYLFVFIGLVVFCILTSPMLLIAIAACLGACYIISLKNRDNKLKIMGRELSLAQQYGAVGLCSFPLFWLAGAGSAVFWVIGASFFVIMLHASFYTPGDEGEPFDLEMEPV